MFWSSTVHPHVAALTCTHDRTVTHLIDRMFEKNARFELRNGRERFVGSAVAEDKDERPVTEGFTKVTAYENVAWSHNCQTDVGPHYLLAKMALLPF